MKKKTSVQDFADSIRDNPAAIIHWAEKEIDEYQKLIKIVGRLNDTELTDWARYQIKAYQKLIKILEKQKRPAI